MSCVFNILTTKAIVRSKKKTDLTKIIFLRKIVIPKALDKNKRSPNKLCPRNIRINIHRIRIGLLTSNYSILWTSPNQNILHKRDCNMFDTSAKIRETNTKFIIRIPFIIPNEVQNPCMKKSGNLIQKSQKFNNRRSKPIISPKTLSGICQSAINFHFEYEGNEL